MKAAVVVLVGAMLAAHLHSLPPPLHAQTAPAPPVFTGQDLARGKELFAGQCASCHGPEGEGGTGANLALPRLRHAPDDRALFRVIDRGISGTEMPGSLFTEREIWQLVAHVRSLGRRPVQPVPGDPARGKALYAAKGCAQCHIVEGQGQALGPELSDIGARRSAAHLRQSLLDPQAAFPQGFLQVVAVTRDGRKVPGIRINEDTFSIRLRDMSGNAHGFWKSELADLQRERGKSPMPAYAGMLSASELDDIVAYLVSLRGGL